MDKKTKNEFKNFNKYNLGRFKYIIDDNDIIKPNQALLESCKNFCGNKKRDFWNDTEIDFEDINIIILIGAWERLNQNLELYDFYKIDGKDYFNALIKTIKSGENSKSLGYYGSLPRWLFDLDFIHGIREESIEKYAIELAQSQNEMSYLGTLYILTHYSDKIDINPFKRIPLESYLYSTFNFEYLTQKITKADGNSNYQISYTLNKMSYRELSLKCYSTIYKKEFSTIKQYENFIKYCKYNYLAKWKFLQTLGIQDYERLFKDPLKLLEILTLTNKYFYLNDSNIGSWFKATDNSKHFLNFMEENHDVSNQNPFKNKQFSKYYYNNEEINNKSINALKLVADKLKMNQIFNILNLQTIDDFNNSDIKTNDILDYKYLSGFVILSQYQRLISHNDKEKVFDTLNDFWQRKFISWPMEYFLSDLLIQIDSKKAIEIFKTYFEKKPTDGSFSRHGILRTIIKHAFDENSEFIENWYWEVHGKEFNHHPIEYKLILELLIEGNESSQQLYNKIENDIRFKE